MQIKHTLTNKLAKLKYFVVIKDDLKDIPSSDSSISLVFNFQIENSEIIVIFHPGRVTFDVQSLEDSNGTVREAILKAIEPHSAISMKANGVPRELWKNMTR